MDFQSVGDLASSFLMQRQNTSLKTQMSRLTQELASGRSSDLTRQLSGSFGQLADVEHQMQLQQSLGTATAEAALFTSSMQSALALVQDQASELGQLSALANTTPGATLRSSVAVAAGGHLDAIISALNTDVAGRPLFSGADLDGAPLASAGDILSAVRTATAGSLDAADFMARLDGFFDTPGGDFETLIYQGGTTNLSPYQLGEGQSVQLSIRADDPAFRDAIKYTVAAALADDATLTLGDGSRDAIVRQAGEALLTQAGRVTRIQADLGYAESRIEQSSVRIAAELTSLEYARSSLVAVDPFETATELENVRFQLETLYTVTARSARLNLMSFLS